MNEIETLQPKPFRDIDAVLYAPRDAEDAVPNPFAIPPEWLAAWQAEADDRAVMAVAAAQAQETAALKAASAASAANVKPDGILASLSEVIPKFFQKLDVPAKKSSGPEDWLKSAQDAVTSVIGGAEQQVQSALSSSAQQVGHGAATGASQGFLQTLETGLPSLISKAQEALDPAVKQIVTGAVAAAKPGVEELAHSAGKHATAGAQEQLHEGGTGLKIDTTTWLVGGVAVLGAIGLGAWLLSPSDRRFGATSTEELQKMLDSASWVRPSRGPTVKWLEAPKSEHFVSKTRDAKSKDNLLAVDGDSGFGTGIAVIGGASALAVLIGYLAKGKLDKDKTAGGAYGTGLGGSSPSGHIAHRSTWSAGRQAGGIYRASPYHPYTLADAFGLSKEHLHLDENAILGPNASSQDRNDYAAGYPIGRKAGLDNCDATRRNQSGTVYVKDATRSQAWDNGWLKGYYDGWVAEGCKANLPGHKTASGAAEDDLEAGEHPHGNEYWWASESTANGPDTTWSYIFTYQDGTSQTDPTPTPNAQISVTDNLVPDTAKAAKAVKVERVRNSDSSRVTVWTADKGASGPPPAFGIVQGLWDALLPWQQAAAIKYKATHPSFGSDWQEMIRVLAITPEQIKKANASYVPFAGADAMAENDPSSAVV